MIDRRKYVREYITFLPGRPRDRYEIYPVSLSLGPPSHSLPPKLLFRVIYVLKLFDEDGTFFEAFAEPDEEALVDVSCVMSADYWLWGNLCGEWEGFLD